MRDAPGLAIVLTPETEAGWRKATPDDSDEIVLHRDFGRLGGVVVKAGGETRHKGAKVPVSHTLPRAGEDEIVGCCNRDGHDVLELANGHYATADGQRIVDSAKAADAHGKTCGYSRET